MAASLVLCAPQFAMACHGDIPLTKIDVAFAEVIFEGRIRDVLPYIKGRSSELTFDVDDVVRGDLPEERVTVVLQGGSAYAAPKTLDEFVARYGENTRIALTTPQQTETFCRNIMGSSVSGLGEITKRSFYRCDYPLLSLSQKAKEKPFVIRRTCGTPYLFDVAVYEKAINFDANKKRFESQPQAARTAKLWKEMVGGGRLPWAYAHSGHSQTVAIELYRNYGYLFTAALREDDAAQNMLLEKGVELIRDDKTFYPQSPTREKDIEYFKGRLQQVLLQISSVVEKDPDFGNRLLEDD